ncbi:MAG TPA: O-antigen ligase family protein [Gaiellaceae bacterium]|nr:O-antigen ligase family protein [Gaiellaceae bacterium]
MGETFAEAAPVAAAHSRRALYVGCLTFVFLTSAGAAHGGYFEGSWGWLTLVAAWAMLIALLLEPAAGISRSGLLFVGLLGAYTVWSLLSALWSVDPTASVLEGQRNLVYVAGAGALLIVARRARVAVVAGAWAAIVALAGYALLTRLVPDRFGVVDQIASYRLSEPIGYWNALSLLAAVGVLLGAAFAARAYALPVRIVGAMSVPPLAAAMYYTFSRGGWASLAIGVVVLVVVDPRRVQALWWLALLGVAAFVAVVVARWYSALSTNGAPLSAQTHAGHRTLLVLAVVSVLTGAGAFVWARVERNLPLDEPRVAHRATLAVGVVVVLAAIAFFAVEGAPWSVAHRAWHSFASAPPAEGSNLSGRLFHLSGSGRVAQWHVAWNDAKDHLIAGSGAGTWEHYWNLERPRTATVTNVHNLYLEALATLGVVGLVLLAAALLVPVANGLRRRHAPIAPFVLAAFTAYLAHAIVDWDWQLTGVTLPVLAAIAAVLLAGPAVEGPNVRPALYGVGALLAALAIWGIGSQTALSKIDSWSSAQHAADIQPWSTEPWQRLGELDIARSRFAEARRALEKATGKDSRNWELWFDLARASTGSAQTRALAQASRLNPRSPEVAQLRGTLSSLRSIGQKK